MTIAMTDPVDQDGGSRSVLVRAFSLLSAFSAKRPVLGLGELAAHANLPKSTTHRLAASLVECGMLERYSDAGYCVGSVLHDVGLLAPSRTRLVMAASPILHELLDQVGGTVHLGVRTERGFIYLDKVFTFSEFPLRTRPGMRFPGHSTSLGKCLLAFGGPNDSAPAGNRLLRRFTQRTITDPVQLARELDCARELGFARDREETMPGLSCVSAPIRASDGALVAAISVSMPTARLNEARTVQKVVRACDEVGRAWDGRSQHA